MLRELIQAQGRDAIVARTTPHLRPLEGCGCVEYIGARNNSGYTKLNFRHKGDHVQVYAHRLFWVLNTGKNIPANMVVDHMCCNRACVNPSHLQLVTPVTNSRLVHKRTRKSNP